MNRQRSTANPLRSGNGTVREQGMRNKTPAPIEAFSNLGCRIRLSQIENFRQIPAAAFVQSIPQGTSRGSEGSEENALECEDEYED